MMKHCRLPVVIASFAISITSIAGEPDLKNIVWEEEIVTDISKDAEPWKNKLADEVSKIVTAGHLAPFRWASTEGDIILEWAHSGQLVRALSMAYPYLPPDLQEKTKTYLRKEIEEYPPWYTGASWSPGNLPVDKGARREWYAAPGLGAMVSKEKDRAWLSTRINAWIQHGYGIWLYARNTGDTETIDKNWQMIQSYFHSNQKMGLSLYSDLAGYIGIARLAKMTGHDDIAYDAENFIKQNIGKISEFDKVEKRLIGDDSTHLKSNSAWIAVFFYLTPETARFIKENSLAEAREYLDSVKIQRPAWFLNPAPGYSGGEISTTPPGLSWPVFQAEAEIFGADPKILQCWVDIPYCKVGDLYYIENLVSLIKAFGKKKWRKL